MRHPADHVAGEELRVLEQLIDGVHRRARNAGAVGSERAHYLLDGAVADPRPDDAVDLVAALDATRDAAEARILAQLRTADGGGERAEELVARHRDHDPAVAGAIAVVGRRAEMAVADARWQAARGGEDRRPAVEQGEHGVLARDVDGLAASGPGAGAQRAQDPDGAEQTLDVVAERAPAARRRVLREAGERHE